VPGILPSLRTELLGVVAEEILPSMHGIDCIYHDAPLRNENWLIAIYTSSFWENRVSNCKSCVGWDGWEKTKSCRKVNCEFSMPWMLLLYLVKDFQGLTFLNAELRILEISELRIARQFAIKHSNFVAELLPALGLPRKLKN